MSSDVLRCLGEGLLFGVFCFKSPPDQDKSRALVQRPSLPSKTLRDNLAVVPPIESLLSRVAPQFFGVRRLGPA